MMNVLKAIGVVFIVSVVYLVSLPLQTYTEAQAPIDDLCGTWEQVDTMMKDGFNATEIVSGIDKDMTSILVWWGLEGGHWALMIKYADGTACMEASGKYSFEGTVPGPEGEKM